MRAGILGFRLGGILEGSAAVEIEGGRSRINSIPLMTDKRMWRGIKVSLFDAIVFLLSTASKLEENEENTRLRLFLNFE